MNTILSEIFFDTSYLFIIIGTFIALFFGLGLIFAPAATLKLSDKISTHVSLRKKTRSIETSIKAEPLFYKYAKISATVLIAGSLFVLYSLTTFDYYSLVPYLPKQVPPLIWEWLLQAGRLFFFISCSFTLVFGLIVLFRPSLIKNLESTANRWISTRQLFSFMSNDINIANKLVSTYPRSFGGIFSFSALIILFFLLPGF